MPLIPENSDNLDVCTGCGTVRKVPLDEEAGCVKCERKWSLNGKPLDYLDRRHIRVDRYLAHCSETGQWP